MHIVGLMERFARDALDKFLRGKLAAVLVDVGAEPFPDKAEFSLGDAGLPVGMGFFKGVEELGGIEVAEDIGGEVSDEPKRPMNILEASFGIVGRGDVQVVVHLLVPDGRDVFHFQRAFNEGFFHFKPEDDVEAIGDFIGFDPDERGADLVDG